MPRRHCLPMGLLGLMLLASSSAQAGKRQQLAPETETEVAKPIDPFSEAGLAAILAEVQPLVEAAAGRPFKTPIVLVLTEDVAFTDILGAESTWIYKEVMPETPESIREGMIRQSARAQANGLLGKYGVLSKEVYLPKQLLQRAPEVAGLDEDQLDDVLRLIVAHEITHALNDQHADLVTQIQGLQDAEHLAAAAGVWEGFATWVEGEVARKLGLEEVFWKLNALQGWGPDGLEDVQAWSAWSRYGVGRNFIGFHAKQGSDALWKPILALPTETAMLFRPESYSAEPVTAPRDYAAALSGVEQKLSKGDWIIANTRVGEADLRGETIHDKANFEALDAMVENLVWAQQLALQRTDRDATIRILEFKDDDGPKQLFELLRAQRTAVNNHQSAELGKQIEVVVEPFTDVQADDAVLRIERIPLSNGRYTERHAAWVVRDKVVVVVVSERFRPGLRTGWTVEAVFSRLDAL